MSMSYVSNSDFLNFLTDIGADLDLIFQYLWKHVLCLEFIRLRWRVKDESTSRTIFGRFVDIFNKDPRKTKALKYLREWEGKFWITMDQNIKELTEKVESKLAGEFGVEINALKASGQAARELSSEKKSEFIARAKKIINAEQLSELAGVIDAVGCDMPLEGLEFFPIIQADQILGPDRLPNGYSRNQWLRFGSSGHRTKVRDGPMNRLDQGRQTTGGYGVMRDVGSDDLGSKRDFN
jgi:hypothetical protein